MKKFRHRDQIHEDVSMDRLAMALLDTPAMQRLGRVYQLGYTHLVYRGGTHTRLSHVMGTYHVAGEFVAALRENYDLSPNLFPRGAVRPDKFLPAHSSDDSNMGTRWDVLLHLVRWSALLHDLAHIPLGHTLEDEFTSIYTRHDDFHSPRLFPLWCRESQDWRDSIRGVLTRQELHPTSFKKCGVSPEAAWAVVLVTCLFKDSVGKGIALGASPSYEFQAEIESASEKNPSNPFYRELKMAWKIAEKYFSPYMADIVGNTICADYLDYIQRDPKNLGLDALGYKRVISGFWVGRRRDGVLKLSLALEDRRGKPRLDATTAVVDLVRQRFRLAESVYYHKTKAAASTMFAKAIELIGKPEEVSPEERKQLHARDVKSISELLLALPAEDRSERLSELEERYSPTALLDVEIGDESLGLLLLNAGWRRVRAAIADPELAVEDRRNQVEQGLRSIALLMGLARRRLYKARFVLTYDVFKGLRGGSDSDGSAVETDLAEWILALREHPDRRAKVQSAVEAVALEFLDKEAIQDPFLIYVPARKAQAKGIETAALERGEVLTLGQHKAVREQVNELSARYAGLWRLMLFAHPDLSEDVVFLSHAADALVKALVPSARLSDPQVRQAMLDGCWFEYIPAEYRQQAQAVGAYIDSTEPRVQLIEEARATCTDAEPSVDLALRVAVLVRLRDRGQAAKAGEILSSRFNGRDSLMDEVEQRRTVARTELFEGKDAAAITRDIIDEIVEELLSSGPSPKKRKTRRS